MDKASTAIIIITLLVVCMFGACTPKTRADVPPEVEWSKTFGGPNSDYGFSLVMTGDGGFAIIGITTSFGAGHYDLWLVKTDAEGNKLWDKTFGGQNSDGGYRLVETDDGGFAIVGVTYSFGAEDGDAWIVKTDADGNELWNKTYGGPNFDCGHGLVKTDDGGFAITGYTKSYGAEEGDLWLVRTDADGNELWNKTYEGPNFDYGFNLVKTSDGGFAITGYTKPYDNGKSDLLLVRTDAAGNKLWDKTFGGPYEDRGTMLIETSDGGFAITGYTKANGYELFNDLWLIRTDAAGNKLWDKTFGGPNADEGRSLIETRDGGFAITGSTTASDDRGDLWLIKTDAAGNKLWDKTFGGPKFDYGFDLVETDYGSFIITGRTFSFGEGNDDVWLIKTASPVQSSVLLTCSSSPALIGSAVNCSTLITGSSPTGTITWTSNSTTGTFASATTPVYDGVSNTTYTDTTPSTVNITATYSGDQSNLPSSSNFILVIVEPDSSADLNGDSTVNFKDITYFVDAYTQYWKSLPRYADPKADFNHDGKINSEDFTLFINAYRRQWLH
ncbi:MAG: hypothetical protein NWF05_09285 [Candidatus Bathyarchaeota archaeon]|nr:hypothetical protein [Candidatus Bathyarchaeota archaeon]